MNLVKAYTQGGQTQLHNLRMIKQVVGATLLASFIVGLGLSVYLLWKHHTPNEIMLFLWYQWAKIRPSLSFLPSTALTKLSLRMEDGRLLILGCQDVLTNPAVQYLVKQIMTTILYGVYSMLGTFFSVSFLWILIGKKRQESKLLKGVGLTSPHLLKRLVKRQGRSPIHIAGIPLPKKAETEHIMITGTTGSGKTNAINSLVQQIRSLNQKAIIIDTTGGYVSRFYDASCDKILNPFDLRTENWDLWQECKEDYEYLEFAESLIPSSFSYDPFWSNASRQLLTAAIIKLKTDKNRSIKQVLNLLLSMPFEEACQQLKGTYAAPYYEPKSEKTANNIRSSMVSTLWCLQYLQEGLDGFSIRK